MSSIEGMELPDLPLEMGILQVVNGIPPGGTNVYGPTYRETYTYNTIRVDWMIQYGIGFSSSGNYIIKYPNPTGIIHLNQLLIREGLLHISDISGTQSSIYSNNIVWSESTAWADGGSWGRININIRGRQSNGLVCPTKYHEVRDDIARMITTLLPGCSIYKPEELWNCSGIPPDILVKYPGYEFGDNI